MTTLTDANPRWRETREAIEREARSLLWWIGIWDDTPAVHGVPMEVLQKISMELHRAWLSREHPMHSIAQEIVCAHADEEVKESD